MKNYIIIPSKKMRQQWIKVFILVPFATKNIKV